MKPAIRFAFLFAPLVSCTQHSGQNHSKVQSVDPSHTSLELLSGYISDLGPAAGTCLAPAQYTENMRNVPTLREKLAEAFVGDLAIDGAVPFSNIESNPGPGVRSFPFSDYAAFTVNTGNSSYAQKHIRSTTLSYSVSVDPTIVTNEVFQATTFGKQVGAESLALYNSIADKKAAAKAAANYIVSKCGNAYTLEIQYGTQVDIIRAPMSPSADDNKRLAEDATSGGANLWSGDALSFQYNVYGNSLNEGIAQGISKKLSRVDGSEHGFTFSCGNSIADRPACEDEFARIADKLLAQEWETSPMQALFVEYSDADIANLLPGELAPAEREINDLIRTVANQRLARFEDAGSVVALKSASSLKKTFKNDSKMQPYFDLLDAKNKGYIEGLLDARSACFKEPLNCRTLMSQAKDKAPAFLPDPFVFSKYHGQFRKYCDDSMVRADGIFMGDSEMRFIYWHLQESKRVEGPDFNAANATIICEKMDDYFRGRSSLDLLGTTEIKPADTARVRFLSILPDLKDLRAQFYSGTDHLVYSSIESLYVSRSITGLSQTAAYFKNLRKLEISQDRGIFVPEPNGIQSAPNLEEVYLRPSDWNFYRLQGKDWTGPNIKLVDLGEARIDLEIYLDYAKYFGSADCKDVPNKDELFKKMGEPLQKLKHRWKAQPPIVPVEVQYCPELMQKFCDPNGPFGANACDLAN